MTMFGELDEVMDRPAKIHGGRQKATAVTSGNDGSLTRIVDQTPPSRFATSGAADLESVAKQSSLTASLVELRQQFFHDYRRAISWASAQGLQAFLARHVLAAAPTLTAESSGKIVAVWRSGNQSVTLRFVDGTDIHYALVLESAEGIKRPWGPTTRYRFFAEQPSARHIVCPAA